jgi:hypothetical protein
MAIGANLPDELWPEVSRAAVYLHNRKPKYTYNWKTPYDRFHTHLAYRDGVVVEDRKPQQAHLKVYGCKAFVMTIDAMKKANRLQRLKPKAWIGFLVGYDSTNIYRIWNPQLNKVFRTREVTFNEESIFDRGKEAKQTELDISKLQTVISSIEEPEPEEIISATDQQLEEESSLAFIQGFYDDDTGVYEVGEPSGEQPMDIDKPETEFEYPTPSYGRRHSTLP